MRPQTVVRTGVGSSTLLCPDTARNPFRVDFDAVVGGTVSDYTVEYTPDNPFAAAFDPATARWIVTSVAAASASAQGIILTGAARAVRVRITTGTGTVTLTLHQSSHGRGG